MKLKNKVAIITGATGGIGWALAVQLADQGVKLVLAGRNRAKLHKLLKQIQKNHGQAFYVAEDLNTQLGRQKLIDKARKRYGRIDLLINNAGVSELTLFEQQSEESIQSIIQTNLTMPVLLIRQLLPFMLNQGSGRIVNIGSSFGSIGFGCYSVYSASKFGLRGFSEALRRELYKTGIGVSYISPRATKTGMNSDSFYQLAKKIGFRLDEPDWVAGKIIKAIRKDKKDTYLGFPEKMFVRINSIFPRRVDSGVRKQIKQLKHFLHSQSLTNRKEA